MPSFFDRFRDLDSLKEEAEALFDQGVRESKRQAALARLRVRIFDLDRRMNAEFRVLGEKVWDLHNAASLTAENLAGAFDVLSALADEIAEAKEDLLELSTPAGRAAAESPAAPAPESPATPDDAERRIEQGPSPDDGGRPPLE